MGLVYALIAAGLSLIFGLMELVNFAHGEFLMVAMYVTFFAWSLAHLDPVVALPLAALALAGLGWAVYHGIIRWVLGGPMLAQAFATFGLALLLRACAPFVGGVFALIAYVTVALGGFGNVPATLLAGVLVGLVEVFAGLLISPAMKYAVVFLLYLAVVLWRPLGLFGRF